MQENLSIPAMRVDASQMPFDQGFESWYDIYRPYYCVQTMDGTLPYSDWLISVGLIQDLVVGCFKFGPFLGMHGVPEVRKSARDYVSLRFQLRGKNKLLVGDRSVNVGVGDVHLIDSSVTSSILVENPIETCHAYIPYQAIGYDPTKHSPHMCFPAGSPIGDLLKNAICSLSAEVSTMSPECAPTLAAGFYGLVRGLIIPNSTDKFAENQVTLARAESMRAFLEERLQDPEVGVDDLCKKFHASRRTVYRLFEEFGGVSKFVADRRLAAALTDLSNACPERGIVGMVAERWGFSDQHYFSRVFKSKFGFAPGEVVGFGYKQPCRRDDHIISANSTADDVPPLWTWLGISREN